MATPRTDTRAANLSRPSPDHESLLDVSSIARRMGVNVRYVRRLVAERRIPYYKVGHLLRFDPVEVEHWLAERRVEAAMTR